MPDAYDIKRDASKMKDVYWPTRQWRSAEPRSMDISAESLENLDRRIKAHYRDISAFLVVKEGYLVFERYFCGCGPEDKHLVASVTKSFISALIGIANDMGFIEEVHQPVLDFFPEYILLPGEHLKRQITIKHLLTMTAGFQWRTGARNREPSIDRLRRSADWVAFILSLPVQERSIGSFQYNSAASHLLSAIITRCTGCCAQVFAAEHLFGPIGIEPPVEDIPHTFNQADVFRNTSGVWPKDPQGNNIGGWGLFLKPRDLARFGILYLRGGQWNGKQIVSRQWIDDSIYPHTPEYGYLWWLRDAKGVFVFSAIGQGGQHIFCIPEKDLVVVVASRMGSRWRDRWELLENFVIPEVGMGSIEIQGEEQ